MPSHIIQHIDELSPTDSPPPLEVACSQTGRQGNQKRVEEKQEWLAFDYVLPACDVSLAKQVDSHLFDEFYHLQFGGHLASAAHYTLNAFTCTEQLEAHRADSLVSGFVLVESGQRFEGRRSGTKLIDVTDFSWEKFIDQLEFSKVTYEQSLEIDAEFHGIIFGSLVHLLIELDLLLFEQNLRTKRLPAVKLLFAGNGALGLAVVSRSKLSAEFIEREVTLLVKMLKLPIVLEGRLLVLIDGIERIRLVIFSDFYFIETSQVLIVWLHPI